MKNLPFSKDTKNTFVALIAGLMVIILAIIVSIVLKFNLVQNLVMSWILTTIYALFAFFFIEPKVQLNPVKVIEKPIIREVEKKIVEIVETPVIKEVENKIIEIIEKPIIEAIQIPIENRIIELVERPIIKPIQIPVENRVIEVVEMPVIKEVQVEKIVYRTIEKQHKKLNIPKFEFIGSTQTKTYHKRNCKFSKMLKKKYKLQNNSMEFFKNKHFHACKTCMKRKGKKEHNPRNIKPKKISLKKQGYVTFKKYQSKEDIRKEEFLRKRNLNACLDLFRKN